MRIKGVIWVGTRTARFEEMVEFVQETLGVPAPPNRESGLAAFELSDGTLFEVFDAHHPGGGHPPSGVVAGFEVDDAAAAYEELVAAGVEISELHEADGWAWAYFRAPDGCLYEIAQRDR